jgi:hypothetical protein
LIRSLLLTFEIEIGPHGRSTDGLLPEYEEKSSERYFGTGMLLFLPDHSAEPVLADLSLNGEMRTLQAARIQFGWHDWDAVGQGSRSYRKVARKLAAMPRADYNWRWTFRLLRGEWSARHDGATCDPRLWPRAHK